MRNTSLALMVVLFCSAAYLPEAHARWLKHLPKTEDKAGSPGWLRTAVHVHSVHSHDACDKKPSKNGVINERCLNDFRDAFCKNHYDVVFVTEHRTELAYIPFRDVLPTRDQDQDLYENGVWIGKRHRCADNHEVTFLVGSENELMPLGLTKHPKRLPGMTLEQTYNAYSPEAAEAMREAGAIIGVSHMESRAHTIESLRSIRPEFVESYNLHANLKWIYEGKNIWRILKYGMRLLTYLGNPFVEPDLIFLGFFREDPTAMQRWGQLASEQEVSGVFGVDSHQNALKTKMYDGERIDSYRRTTRWFSNWVRKQPEIKNTYVRQSMLGAIAGGQVIGVMEILGQPNGFDFFADATGKLTVVRPTTLPSSTRLLILKASEKGWTVVAQADDKNLEYQPTGPGAYIAQLRMTPKHLRKYLRGMSHLIKDMPWVVSSPIYLKN